MNPEVDLTHFRRGGSGGGGPIASAMAAGPSTATLVSPPRRILTRYVLPLMLMAAFAAVGAYAVRDALVPTTAVKVVLPVPATGAVAEPTETTEPAEPSTDGAPPVTETIAGAPLFQAPGWVEPYPFRRDISALTPGIVRRLNVLEGQQVSPGTVVAELVDDDVRIAVRQAEAELNMKKAELEAAITSRDNPLTLREAVRTAQAELERLKAEKNRTQQSLTIAQRESQVNQSLASRGAAGTFQAQKTALEARGAELAVVEIDAKIRSAEAVLQSAQERMKLLVEENNRVLVAKAAVEKAQAALEEARYRLQQRRVVAQTTGTVMSLYVGEGATLSMDMGHGLRIASVYDPTQLQVRADVPLAEVAKLQVGMPVEVKVDALPDRSFKGEVTRIVHEADVQKNTLPVKVRLTDPDPALKPEMIARLQFSSVPRTVTRPAEGGQERSGTGAGIASSTPSGASVLIPASLVPDEAREAKLWVVSPNQTALQRTVQLGPKMPNGLRAVVSGIETPDKIIASNTDKLKEGSRVRIAATE